MKTPKSIEVVRTNIKSLSSMSNESAVAIVASLSQQYSDVRLTIVNTKQDLTDLIERKPNLVFLGIMHLMDGDKKIWLSEELEQAGIPHTGSTHGSHELEISKNMAKQRIIKKGLMTAPFKIVNIGQPYSEQLIGLDFPLFVKPLSSGGGKGIDEYSVVRNSKQLNEKISSLQTNYNVDVLVESYLEGREFSVAVIRTPGSDELVAMPLELIAPKDFNGQRMLSKQVKSDNAEQALGIIDSDLKTTISKFALDVFRALDARDYGRIDIRLDGSGVPNFLEANLMPSLITEYGSFPKAYKINQNVDYKEMINNIALLGLSRAKTI